MTIEFIKALQDESRNFHQLYKESQRQLGLETQAREKAEKRVESSAETTRVHKALEAQKAEHELELAVEKVKWLKEMKAERARHEKELEEVKREMREEAKEQKTRHQEKLADMETKMSEAIHAEQSRHQEELETKLHEAVSAGKRRHQELEETKKKMDETVEAEKTRAEKFRSMLFEIADPENHDLTHQSTSSEMQNEMAAQKDKIQKLEADVEELTELVDHYELCEYQLEQEIGIRLAVQKQVFETQALMKRLHAMYPEHVSKRPAEEEAANDRPRQRRAIETET